MKKTSCQNIIFGKMTNYQTLPFCMAFVLLTVTFFVDYMYYCTGVSNRRFHFGYVPCSAFHNSGSNLI